MRSIEVLPIKTVDDYYDFHNHQKKWIRVHTGRYQVKEQKGEEPVEMDIEIFKNIYGDTYVSDGFCVLRHVIIDSRGWIIEWLDEDNYAVAIIPHWIESADFHRRFHTGHTMVTTRSHFEERVRAESALLTNHK